MPRISASSLPAAKLARSAANPGVAVGDVVGGKYRVDGELAEGGMGIVLVATHLELDCPVALKLIRPEHLANEAVVERLLSEARIAASLHSKHVNRILDVGRTASGVPYLVLEYMAGSDLYSYLQRRGQLPVTEAVDYVLQVCEALAEAHAIGIVHRDLKPENVFLSEEADGGFTVKVLDFGISKAPRRRGLRTVTSSPFAIIGSPTYMSPEQVRGMEVDNRADIWALGALLHELCTGDALFEAPSMARTFVKITDEGYFPASYGKSSGATLLHQVVCRCLRRNRDERYRDVVELARELGPLGTDGTQAARVAKVATASRARVIAATGQEAPDTTTTPLAITRAELEPAQSVRSPWRWTLIGIAAFVPLAL
ncbi:MAG TPA: serine/threonine-protein kinase, partial [Polyangiaceae bacterium]|nr:serine/threonine-protein kinase [Polyangiaceae bacterium]